MGIKPLFQDLDLVNEIDASKSSFSYNQQDGIKLLMKKAKPGQIWQEVFPVDGSKEQVMNRYSET